MVKEEELAHLYVSLMASFIDTTHNANILTCCGVIMPTSGGYEYCIKLQYTCSLANSKIK